MAAVRERAYGGSVQNSGRTQSGRYVQESGRTQSTRNVRNAGRTQSGGGRAQYNNYVQGNTVRKPDVTREIEREPRKKLSNTARKNREKARYMDAGYVFFLSLALVATAWILVSYITLQSDITNRIQRISSLERELNDLRLANDEEYNRITSSIDLEEVRRIAIQELGMKYAEEGQIVTFESENSDYVKQMSSIPK